MPLSQIIFIRHAEEHSKAGLTEQGAPDDQSLTVRGWQRAGALARFFTAQDAVVPRPDVVYASRVTAGSESRRPGQTVSPLVALCTTTGRLEYVDTFAKPQTADLAADILTRDGTVLVCWEHSKIVECIAALPQPPKTPAEWPGERYDLLWCLHRTADGWTFEALPQQLLAGDAGSKG